MSAQPGLSQVERCVHGAQIAQFLGMVALGMPTACPYCLAASANKAEIQQLTHQRDGYRGAVERLNKLLELRKKPERPWGWYREITPGTFTVEKGDWPPPEPDDVAWLPLYASPEGRPGIETKAEQRS